MKSLKKIIALVVFTACIIIPFQVFACPHVDRHGRIFTMRFDADLTVAKFVFFNENYWHHQNALINNNLSMWDTENNTIIGEAFEFHMWRYSYETKQLKLVMESTDNRLVNGINFNLNIGLKNTLQSSRTIVNNSHWEFSYSVFATRLNDAAEEGAELRNVRNGVAANRLTQVLPEILKIETAFSYLLDDTWVEGNIGFNKLYDPIEIQIFSEERFDNVVAININNDNDVRITERINVVYDDLNQIYRFEIRDAGIYIIVKNDF